MELALSNEYHRNCMAVKFPRSCFLSCILKLLPVGCGQRVTYLLPTGSTGDLCTHLGVIWLEENFILCLLLPVRPMLMFSCCYHAWRLQWLHSYWSKTWKAWIPFNLLQVWRKADALWPVPSARCHWRGPCFCRVLMSCLLAQAVVEEASWAVRLGCRLQVT